MTKFSSHTRETHEISNTYIAALLSLTKDRPPSVYACLHRLVFRRSDCGLNSTIRTWQLKKGMVEFPFTWAEGGWQTKPNTKPPKVALRPTTDTCTEGQIQCSHLLVWYDICARFLIYLPGVVQDSQGSLNFSFFALLIDGISSQHFWGLDQQSEH